MQTEQPTILLQFLFIAFLLPFVVTQNPDAKPIFCNSLFIDNFTLFVYICNVVFNIKDEPIVLYMYLTFVFV